MIFEDVAVVVTGAGQGIGRSLSVGFAKDGAHVVGISRTESDLAETARLCGGEQHMRYVVGDISRPQDVERLFAEAENWRGRVDVLVNNAAVYPKQEFVASNIEEWAKSVEINVIGMARCCHRALPGMLERGHGRIINLGSWAWKGPIPMASAYSVSKGAVFVLTPSIACEIDRARYPDVLVNEFLPGAVHTRMTPDRGDDPADVYPSLRDVALLLPNGPHGQRFDRHGLIHTDVGRTVKLKQRIKRFLGI